ncbi:hypothetical protein MRX96_046455 [Rhipicephalus microplus]
MEDCSSVIQGEHQKRPVRRSMTSQTSIGLKKMRSLVAATKTLRRKCSRLKEMNSNLHSQLEKLKKDFFEMKALAEANGALTLQCPDEQPTPEQSTKKRAASPPTCEDQPSKRTALQSVEPQLRFEDCESARQSDNAFELEDVVRPNDHWAMHKFRHYDGIAYVSASLSRELVSIEKTVLMNYGTDRSEVICRTYVRKTLISEKVAYNLEDAKQVLDCAESLHPCRGAGRAKDFTYDVLTKKLEQQISHSDGLVFSVTCKGAVKQQGWRLSSRTLWKSFHECAGHLRCFRCQIDGQSTNLENLFNITSQMQKNGPPGVWLCSTDMVLTCSDVAIDWSCVKDGLLICSICDPHYAANHGAVKVNSDGKVSSILYCGTLQALRDYTLTDGTVLASGVVFCSELADSPSYAHRVSFGLLHTQECWQWR